MNQAIKRKIGARIKGIRKTRKLTQEKLAEEADLNPKYVSSLERGKENPTLDVFVKLSKALKVELGDLFEFEHESDNSDELKRNIQKLVNEADSNNLKLTLKLLKSLLH